MRSPVKLPDKDFGKTRFRSRPARTPSRPARRIVHGKRHRFQVAFKFEARLLDEPLVLRIVRDGGQGIRAQLARPAQIGVEKRVSARQQPSRLRGGVLAQLDGKSHRRSHNHDD